MFSCKNAVLSQKKNNVLEAWGLGAWRHQRFFWGQYSTFHRFSQNIGSFWDSTALFQFFVKMCCAVPKKSTKKKKQRFGVLGPGGLETSKDVFLVTVPHFSPFFTKKHCFFGTVHHFFQFFINMCCTVPKT